ncbi:MAG: putative Ig domain-containing protein, partial [Deltaproteobacteria bacterium]|nr:putative Ig domain-containing protein [Deltaproteobacteria bacterium]
MTRPSARPARYPATAQRFAFLLAMGGALLAAPALAQTGPSFAEGASVAVQTYQPGTAITTLTLPAATGGSGALSYTLTPAGSIPSGLSFSASARTVTGTPAAGAVVASLTYTATDAGGNTDTLPVTIVVRPEPTITVAAATVTNQASNSYTAVLGAQPASDVTLTIRLAWNFVEPLPAGLQADKSSLVFTPSNWNTPQTVTITFTQGLDAGAVFVFHDISIGGRMTHSISTFYHHTIQPRIVISPASLTINEGSSANYTVVWEFLQVRAGDPITITVTPATSDATVATVSGPLTFIHGGPNNNWDTPQMVTVNAVTVGDADTQGGTATISHTETGVSTTVTLASVAVSVVDSDSLRQLSVNVDDTTPDEGGEAVFTVTLNGQAPVAMQPVTVDWAVSGAQAADYSVSGADTDGTLSFTGLGSQSVTLTITDDALSEGEEMLTFTLSNASRADLTTASASVTIGESDRPITVSFGAVLGTGTGEQAEGIAHRFSLHYAEDVDTTAPVEVDWRISFPAASQTVDPADSADFAATTGTAFIAAGDTDGRNDFTITALADNLNEAVETFIVTVSNPRGGGAIAAPSLSSSTTATVTIAASNPVTVSIAGPTPPTAAEGSNAVFRISISNASEGSVSVPWSVNELSDAGIIGATTGTVAFPARTTTLSQNVAIPLAESATLGPLSPTETLTVTLGTVSGGRGTLTGSGATASVTVSFTGAARALTVTGPATIAETDSAVESRDYTIALSGQAFSANTAVTWTVTHGDTSDADFAAASDRSGTVTFGAADEDGATRTFSITVAGDNQSESDETFTVQASVADDMADDGTDFGAAASTTITDDDSRARVLTITGPGAIAENDDATNGVESGDYTVTLTGTAFSTDTVATWTVTHIGTADADFLAADDRSGMLNFDGADVDGSTRTFTITVAGDQLAEGAESFSVQLSVADAAADGGTGYGDPVFTTITDDDSDEIVVYVAGSGAIPEDGTGNPLRVQFRVDLNGRTASGDVVVSYTIVPGSPAFTVDDIALASLTGMVTMDADAVTPVLTAALDIDDTDDSLNEGAESFTVTATAAIGADTLRVINNSGTFTITANDFITAQLSSTTALSEGASPADAVTLTLENTPTTEVTVAYTIGVDTNAATVNASAADYSGATGSATFAANTAPAAVTLLRITDDELNENDEVLTVTIGDDQVRGAIEGSGQNQMSRGASQTYTISASDELTVRIAADAATVNEGASAQFTVSMSGARGGSAAPITVSYTVSGTTDTPTDANGGRIEIAAGQTSGAIALGIPFSQTLDDDSPDETLSVTLGTINVGAAGGEAEAAASPNNAASVTVNYLSAAHTISFTNPATSIVEGGSATYTVSRSGPDIAGAAGIVLRWAYAAGATNPASAADFAGSAAPAGGTLTFTGSQTTRTFSINTAEDALSEPGETFTLSLSATPAVLGSEGGVVLPSAISVTIGESDRPVTLRIAAPGSDLTEGTASNFTVSFTENVTTTAPITVYWRNLPTDISTDTARNPDFDAVGLSGNTVIAAGQNSAVIAITPSADNHNEGPETFTIRITSVDPNSNQRGGPIAAPVIGLPHSAHATIAASDPLTVRLARRSGQTGAVVEGGDAEFTVSLALVADSSTAATSATGICVTFSTAIASQQNPTGAANTASNADLEVRNCAGNVVSTTAAGATSAGGVLIPAGQSSATFGIRARFDNLDEGATGEMLTVTVTSAAFQPALPGATTPVITSTPADARVAVEIENINSARTLAIDAPAASAEEGGDLVFTVTVEGEPVSEAFVVNWAVTTGAADLSGATSGVLNFGVSSQQTQMRTITLSTTDDSANEPAETVTVTLANPCPANGVCAVGGRAGISGAQTPSLELITAAANGAIGESDRPVILQVAAPGSALTEGTAANFTV